MTKFACSKNAGPSVSSPDPAPASETSFGYEVTSADQKHELGGDSLRMVKHSSTSQGSWGNSRGSYLSGGVLTPG